MSKSKRIALAGNPNGGKSSLFNALTGLNQKTGNLPGVTVEKKSGSYTYENEKVDVTDVPGLYSLIARSPDELISSNLILQTGPEAPELFVYVADATQLRKSLFLFLQMKAAGCPLILTLNMSDLALERGIRIDTLKMEEFLGIPVLPVSALKRKGIQELKALIHETEPETQTKADQQLPEPEQIFEQIDQVMVECISWDQKLAFTSRSEKFDKWAMHPFIGYALFFAFLFLMFQAVFSLAEFPMTWIETAFISLGETLQSSLPEGPVRSLTIHGILPGLSGVLMFLPQIAFLFFFLAILEDSGYMVRATLLMDRVMRRVGLNGRSVIPLISGFACAIPAIMSTRTIGNPRDRLITMLITPLISCSARLPVFILLVSLLLPDEKWLGIFNYQGLALTALYLLGFLSAFGTALVLNKGIKVKNVNPFLMEIPEYRFPHWRQVGMQIYEKCKSFVSEAGKIILGISIILWALSSYGPADLSSAPHEETTLEESFAGKAGKFIEPVIAPLGYDWKIGIAIISSFAAREVFVGSMATIYHIEDEEDMKRIKDRLSQEVNPETGEKVFGTGTLVSLLLFYLFALQCVSTLAVMRKETGGWKWPMIQFAFMGILAYCSALLANQLL
ncbi:MAG: ferrous iron transport protein B [Bacteroidetes bacterium]|nr:MAG: ferrous iron transport protein B [Bacteroidota bacterium]